MTDKHAGTLLDNMQHIMQFVLHFAILLIILTLSFYALRLIRAKLLKSEQKAIDYLDSFQKMKNEGKLSAEEFRIIRKQISLQLTRSPNEFREIPKKSSKS